MKRLTDIVVAACAVTVLAPVLVVVALCVIAHDGLPVFFRQQRVGRGGQEFGMFKFRSMVKNAAQLGPYFTAAGDPRITPIGRFIRRTSLDELPQLFNVLLGDMSLVGPRPDVAAQRALYTDSDWAARCSVRPGITGLAQVLLRSEGTQELRCAYDLQYVREHNPWFDLKIMFLTLGRLSGKGSN